MTERKPTMTKLAAILFIFGLFVAWYFADSEFAGSINALFKAAWPL